MNIEVRYYTKSGNTAKLAEAIAEAVQVKAQTIAQPLTEKAALLFLGCSYYAFDMDPEVKAFIAQNKDKIGRIALFGTSAMMKSMRKPMQRVIKGTDIELAEEEFHCRGQFHAAHKGRPNADDLKTAADFAAKHIK